MCKIRENKGSDRIHIQCVIGVRDQCHKRMKTQCCSRAESLSYAEGGDGGGGGVGSRSRNASTPKKISDIVTLASNSNST